jgi:hypothetical protein
VFFFLQKRRRCKIVSELKIDKQKKANKSFCFENQIKGIKKYPLLPAAIFGALLIQDTVKNTFDTYIY